MIVGLTPLWVQSVDDHPEEITIWELTLIHLFIGEVTFYFLILTYMMPHVTYSKLAPVLVEPPVFDLCGLE